MINDSSGDAPSHTSNPQLLHRHAALDHVFDAQAGFLVESDVLDATRLGLAEIGAAGIAAVGSSLLWRLAVKRDVAVQHRQEPLAVRRITALDHQVEDQAAAAGGQVDFVAIFNIAAAFDDDVGM